MRVVYKVGFFYFKFGVFKFKYGSWNENSPASAWISSCRCAWSKMWEEGNKPVRQKPVIIELKSNYQEFLAFLVASSKCANAAVHSFICHSLNNVLSLRPQRPHRHRFHHKNGINSPLTNLSSHRRFKIRDSKQNVWWGGGVCECHPHCSGVSNIHFISPAGLIREFICSHSRWQQQDYRKLGSEIN